MTTYVYETIPSNESEAPQRFEVRQSMRDAALTRHPQTGQPVRRLILGGFGFIQAARDTSSSGECCAGDACESPSMRSACGCGQGGCSH